MRKITAILIAMLLIICRPVVSAASTYQLSDPNIQIDIPDDLYVFTRNTSANDRQLADLGISWTELQEMLKSQNAYLVAYDIETGDEISVIVKSTIITDFGASSDSSLEIIASAMISTLSNQNILASSHNIYSHPQTKFIKLNTSVRNTDVVGVQYLTVYDGKLLNIMFRAENNGITADKQKRLEKIVDSIYFNDLPLLSDLPQAESTPSFTYQDEKSGVSFTVPANWSRSETNQDNQYIDVSFTRNGDSSVMMLYGSVDAWNEMSDRERFGLTRKECNSDAITEAQLEQLTLMSTLSNPSANTSIRKFTYNGLTYFKLTITTELLGASMHATSMIYLDNGWMYQFQFIGMENNELYADFETLLDSVIYPDSVTSAAPVISGAADSSEIELPYKDSAEMPDFSDGDSSGLPNLLITLLITMPLYSIPVLVYRFIFKREPCDPYTGIGFVITSSFICVVIVSIPAMMMGGSWFTLLGLSLWSVVGYMILTAGYTSPVSQSYTEQFAETMPDFQPDVESAEPSMTQFNEAELASRPDTESSELSSPPQLNSVFCRKCGAKLPEDSIFCGICGARIISDQSDDSESEETL